MSIKSVMPSNYLILCRPFLLLPSIFPSIRVFSNESVLGMRWPKYWSFSFNISPFSKYSRLIFFKMGWLDLLAVQGTLKSLLQHHSSKASILWCSAFFILQLSHSYMTTGKTVALTRQIFVGKVKFLLFNMLSRLVITFLPRSKHLLILWLQSPSAVILEPNTIKSVTVSTVAHLFAMKWWDQVMEFQLSYFKSWKMLLWKCCTQYTSKFGKLSSGHRTGKGQFSFQFQRKVKPKNVQSTAQLHSSHMLVK